MQKTKQIDLCAVIYNYGHNNYVKPTLDSYNNYENIYNQLLYINSE